MTPFFDEADVPPPDEPVEHRSPPWAEMAPNVLPVSVPLDVVLVRTGDWAVWIGGAEVGPEGLQFTLTVQGRRTLDVRRMHGFHEPPEEGSRRFGVAFADGRRAIAWGPWAGPGADRAAPAIHLTPRGGSGSSHRWSQTFWLWPLPPEGPLTFAFAWPEQGLEESVAEVDGAPLRAASRRAIELWPDDRPDPPGDATGWERYAV